MTILQIHTFYDQFLSEFYAGAAGLDRQPFEAQIAALVQDGFAGGHMFPPYLRELGYNAHLAIANCLQAQSQWAREKGFSNFTPQGWVYEIARRQVETVKPDVLYLSDPITFDSRFVRSLSWKPSLVMGWRAASIPSPTDWTEFHLMLSHLQVCRQKALERGARAVEHFYPGYPGFLTEKTKDEPIAWDVVFTGQWTGEHAQRNQLILHVARAAADQKRPFSFGLFLACRNPAGLPAEIRALNRGPRWGSAMFRALKSGRMALNAEIDLARGEAGNMRLFEATGTGACLLTEEQPNLERYFARGTEVVTFQAGPELMDKIRHLLESPEECAAIARRGQERCLRDYSMPNRAREFAGIIEHQLGQKSSRMSTSPPQSDSAATLLGQALEKLNGADHAAALNLFAEALRARPEMPQIRLGSAVALARLGRRDEAAQELRALLHAQPAHPKAALLLDELTGGNSASAAPPAQRDAPPEKTQRAVGMLREADSALQANRIAAAFALLNQAKSLREPVRGLDHTRAHCFLKMNQPDGARQALREELRYFPDNLDAKQLLDEVERRFSDQRGLSGGDAEFQSLLQAVRPYTMLSESRLFALFTQAKSACLQNIPGNFVECGVAAGGSSALLAWVLKRYSKQPRRVFAFDSFEGMPAPSAHDRHQGTGADETGWGTGTCAAPEASLREICAKLGVADVVVPVKGYFEQTLPKLRDWVGMISLLHLDGDWYESTRAILENLYDRVVDGGFLQVDDYGHWEGCRKAVQEFESRRRLRFPIEQIDATGVRFIKPDKFPVNPVISDDLVQEFSRVNPAEHSIASQMSPNERFQLFYAVRELLPRRPGRMRFVEIGSFAGASLFLICETLRQRGLEGRGYSVEPGGQPQFYEVLRRLQPSVEHLKMFSQHAVARLRQEFEGDGQFPLFIFVDGDHTYAGVRQDILNYYPLLAPGGVMMFHDYLPPVDATNRESIYAHHANTEPGIRQACQELMEQAYRCEVLEVPLLRPTDPTQTQAYLPIIPGVYSTIRAYRKPNS